MQKTVTLAQRNEAARLYEEYDRLFSADADADVVDAAFRAYDKLDITLMMTEDGKLKRCAISGVPLVDGDDVAIVLVSALVLRSGELPDPPAGLELPEFVSTVERETA